MSLRRSRSWLFGTLAVAAALLPFGTFAGSLPSGERIHGTVAVEPAYDDADGSLIYLQTPLQLAPLAPTNVINSVNPHAVAPLYLVVYPSGTPGTFNCMGVPGNCPDHDGAIAGLAHSVMGSVYTDPNAVPGHDHLVGTPHTGDFNAAWRVYVELFTSTAAVRHITTLSDLDAAKASHDVVEVDTGITFLCTIVSENAYLAGTPA